MFGHRGCHLRVRMGKTDLRRVQLWMACICLHLGTHDMMVALGMEMCGWWVAGMDHHPPIQALATIQEGTTQATAPDLWRCIASEGGLRAVPSQILRFQPDPLASKETEATHPTWTGARAWRPPLDVIARSRVGVSSELHMHQSSFV